MKKFLAIALMFILLLSFFTACKGKTGDAGSSATPTPQGGQDIPVATPAPAPADDIEADEIEPTPAPPRSGVFDESMMSWPEDFFAELIPKPDVGKLTYLWSMPYTAVAAFTAFVEDITEEEALIYMESCLSSGWIGEIVRSALYARKIDKTDEWTLKIEHEYSCMWIHIEKP